MTRAAYLKSIEDADKVIESSGIAHLLVPIKKATRKKPGAKRTAPKKEASKK